MAGASRSILGVFANRRQNRPAAATTPTTYGQAAIAEGRWKGLHAGNTMPLLPDPATGRAGQRRLGDYDTDAVMQEDAIETAARKAGRRARRFVGNGRTQTILTGMDGVAGSAPTVRRTLLGL